MNSINPESKLIQYKSDSASDLALMLEPAECFC